MNTSLDKVYRPVLRVLVTIAAIAYALFIISESIGIKDSGESTFGDAMMYVLFAFFLVAYYFLWKSELISGLLLVLWYGFQWILVMYVWHAAGVTLLLGLPIFILGVILLAYALIKKSSVAPTRKNNDANE